MVGFSRGVALSLLTWSTWGCSLGTDDNRASLKPESEARHSSTSVDSEASEAFSHLPRFVDGGFRCEVHPAPAQTNPMTTSNLAADHDLGFFRAAGGDREDIPCSGPGPWCKLFGPSKTDRENHRLRQEMKAQQQWYEQRGRELRERVKRAENAVRATRRNGMQQLRELGGSSRGIYLTNDDSMSLASPQRLIWAIDNDAPLPSSLVRPHELLNYFSFSTLPVNPDEEFSVLPELSPHPMRATDYTLGFSVKGRAFTKESRRNVNLTYVLDRSGSMAGDGRIDLLKRGVFRSLDELKPGDIVSILLFDTTTCPLAQNFVVGRDDMKGLRRLIGGVTPRGGSNLLDGLGQGYALANRSYKPGYSNRVLLLTDVEGTKTAEDEKLIRLSAQSFDVRRVRLSAVGFGDTVSDELLDRLTEVGKGASMFVSSPRELDAIFGTRFSSLVETIAENVHFRLELPPSISLRAFYGEEASEQKGRVQAVHFFSGTEQMYLANLKKSRALESTDYIRLSIEFDDPETGQGKSSEFSWRADELEMATGETSRFASRNLNKARMVAMFGYQLRYMAEHYSALLRPEPTPTWALGSHDAGAKRQRHRWERLKEALSHCRRVKGRLDAFSAQLGGEPEAARIVELWHRYCGRYEGGEPMFELAEPSAPPVTHAAPETKLVQLDLERTNDFMPASDDLEP